MDQHPNNHSKPNSHFTMSQLKSGSVGPIGVSKLFGGLFSNYRIHPQTSTQMSNWPLYILNAVDFPLKTPAKPVSGRSLYKWKMLAMVTGTLAVYNFVLSTPDDNLHPIPVNNENDEQ